MENKIKRVKFACGGGNVKLSNNDALNQIVNILGGKKK